jgi:translation initiation factor IF-3
MIRIPQVRVVDEEGAQLGVMATPEALAMAQERGLDLVEVAPMASPPVVKFLDFGQYKYELTKREKEAKRKQRSVTFKEVRLKPKIGSGDFDTKVRRAIQFLEEGDRIKVAVQFRGRELTHPEIGRSLLTKFSEQIKDHGVVERSPLLEGKSMHITVASVHKPKFIEHQSKHPLPDEAARPAAEASAPARAEPAKPEPVAAKPSATVESEPAAAKTPAASKPQAAVDAEPAAEPAAAAPEPAPKAAAPKPEPTEKASAPKPETTEPAAPAAATKAAEAAPPAPAPAAKAAPAAAKRVAIPAAKPASATGQEATKPARASARTRKTSEPEAPAPAPAGE